MITEATTLCDSSLDVEIVGDIDANELLDDLIACWIAMAESESNEPTTQ